MGKTWDIFDKPWLCNALYSGGVGFLEILSPKPPGVSGAVSKASRSAGACNGSRNLGNYPF
jgi:hypothetical protein